MTSSLFRGAALLGLGLTLFGGSPQDAAAAEGYLVTGDWHRARVRVQSLTSDRVLYDLSVESPAVRSACSGRSSTCFPMSVSHSVFDDRDFITATLIRTNPLGGFANMYPTTIARFELTTPARETFSIRNLDFRDLPNRAAHCAQPDDAPYADDSKPGCSIQMAHGIKTIEDDPASSLYKVAVADALNARVLGVTLDYAGGNRTGHVDFAVGKDTAGWPANGLPNATQYLAEPDGNYLLVTYYMTGEHAGSAGALIMFKEQSDGTWAKQWRFPETGTANAGFLHSVHMGEIIVDPATGQRSLFYAHGRALASNWEGDPNTDLGGSSGVMALGATLSQAPVYLGEAVPFLSEVEGSYRPFRYARDADFLDDGRLILTDASCENFCPEPGQHFIVEPFHRAMTPSPMVGRYSPDHVDQDLIELTDVEVIEVVQCGHGGIFETDYVSPGGVGRYLRRAERSATLTCADASASGL